jgi:hypothetical protein
VADRSSVDFQHDPDRRDALLWNFTVLGEAVGQLSDEMSGPTEPRRGLATCGQQAQERSGTPILHRTQRLGTDSTVTGWPKPGAGQRLDRAQIGAPNVDARQASAPIGTYACCLGYPLSRRFTRPVTADQRRKDRAGLFPQTRRTGTVGRTASAIALRSFSSEVRTP